MRPLFYRFLLLLVVAWTTSAVVQAQNIASRYSATSSPYSYVAVSSSNSSTLINLKNVGIYPDGILYGDADDGVVLIGNFTGLPNLILPPFTFSLNGTEYGSAATVGANGFYQPARGNAAGSGTVFVDAISSPSASGFYTNSAIQNYIFGFGGDLDLTASTSEWYYAVQGTAPSRRVVVEWRNAKIKNTTTTVTFQIIIHETTGIIDVVYGPVNGAIPNTAFYTGINEGTTSFVSGTTTINAKSINGQSGNYLASRFIDNMWQSSSVVSNPYGSVGVWPNQNIRYCVPKPTVNVTAPNMTLFDGVNNASDRTSVGAPLTKTYTVTNLGTSTTPVKISTQISGAGAAHYSVSPSAVSSLAPNASQTFTVTFNPAAFGDLGATLALNITTPDGATCPAVLEPTSIVLNGRALGLTAVTSPLAVNFGATAMNTVSSRNVALFRNDASSTLTYHFTGPTPSTAEFSIPGASGGVLTGTVGAGEFVYLPVEFSPTFAGVQNATLDFYYTNASGTVQSLHQSVSLSGEGTPSRLRVSKGGTSTHLASGSLFAQSFFGSVGEEPLNFDFTLTNTGVGAPVTASDFEFYDLDRDNPINGRLRVMWSEGFGQGHPIASNDFRVQQYVNGQWQTVGPNDVVSVPAQQSQQMRVQFAPDRRGVNFVRMFFRTDATVDDNYNDISALNAADVPTPGLQSYDFYGITARNSRIATIQPLLFLETEVGETTTASLRITNSGDARLLIEQGSLKLIDGDEDFSIESAFAGMEMDNGRYVIPVNQTGEIVIRFTPQSKGTRLTTLYFRSNDSTEVGGVVGERYVPITGVGQARALISVTAQTETTPFAGDTSIVSVPSSYVQADVRILNTGNSMLNLTDILLRGTDMADYLLLTPFSPESLAPGEEIMVTVQFAPQTGGWKSGELVVRSNAQNGDQVIDLSGFGGERLVGSSTRKVFGTDSIAVGEMKSRVVVIRNTGTVDLDLSGAVIEGDNSGDYTLSGGSAQVLAPNEFATLTVELSSSERGQKKAILRVPNNSTNEPDVAVELGGFVGVRTSTYTPQQISMSSRLGQDGEYEEQTVCVEVTNTGDLAMTLTDIMLSGAQSSQYSHDGSAGMVVGVGETVEVCVTYRPTSSMTAVATLTIETNGTPGTIEIPINGVATSVGEAGAIAAGYLLGQSVPSPAATESVIGYELPTGGVVGLTLYDVQGRVVRRLESGVYRGAGRHEVVVDVRGLESGVYMYRLSVNGYEIVRTLRVVK